VFENKGA